MEYTGDIYIGSYIHTIDRNMHMFDHLITKQHRKAQKWNTIEFFFSPIQTLHIDPEDVINSKIER